MKDAEQSRDASSGQRERAAERTNKRTPSRAERKPESVGSERVWDSQGARGGVTIAHASSVGRGREGGQVERVRASQINERTARRQWTHQRTSARTNAANERTQCTELKPVPSRSHSRCVCPTQSPSGSRCRYCRDASPQWTRLCLGAVGRCCCRCLLLLLFCHCAARSPLVRQPWHSIFILPRFIAAHNMLLARNLWPGLALPLPPSMPLILPFPLPLPLAQRCLWLSSASGALCTNWSSWLSNFCNWSLWRQQRQRDAAATATRLQRTVPRIAHKWSGHS